MADPNQRTPENVPGSYYVDDTCIDCDLCRQIAPQFFRREDEGGYSVVYCQPATAEDIALAEEARGRCPTETIGNDAPDN
ncbi:MAG: ferredoxin [Verrucomicrobiota bacterium]|nr:ferredoxin [Verrucomicrobiota bacterium]